MNRIFDMLARLASLLYQQQFIIAGTRDEYVLPDQLLSEVISYINTMLSNSKFSRTLTENQLEELAGMLHNFERLSSQIPFDDESVSNEELVLQNQYWIDARKLAFGFLENSGFDIKKWEKNNCRSDKGSKPYS